MPKRISLPAAIGCIVMACGFAALPGCEKEQANPVVIRQQDPDITPPAGEDCLVRLKASAIGKPSDADVTSDGQTVSGRLLKATPGWIVVGTIDAQFWIPMDNVLAVEFTEKK
jgi:hypothetical protein